MSLDLKEFRGKITAQADAVINSISESSGREKQEIVRDILHEYAMVKINELRILDKNLEREGLSAIIAERRGTRGKAA